MEQIIIKNNDVNQRFDKYIKKIYPSLPLLFIIKGIRIGKIKVNDKKVDISYRTQLNDRINIYLNNIHSKKENRKESQNFNNASSTLDVVYEDENIMVVNKPIGVSSQPDKYSLNDSLIQRIQKYLFNKKEFDPINENVFSPQLCNRIDRNTQGLVLAAKNLESLNIMNQKIKNKEIQKYYLTKIHGSFDKKSGVLTDYLTKLDEENGVKITKGIMNKDSVKIVTEYETIVQDKFNNSVLEIHLITGKKHQIRAHMCFYRHPLFGEQKYCLKEYKDNCKEQQLYSYKVVFDFFSPSGKLSYLKGKSFSLNKDKIINTLLMVD